MSQRLLMLSWPAPEVIVIPLLLWQATGVGLRRLVRVLDRQSGRKDAPCAGTPWNSSGRSFSC